MVKHWCPRQKSNLIQNYEIIQSNKNVNRMNVIKCWKTLKYQAKNNSLNKYILDYKQHLGLRRISTFCLALQYQEKYIYQALHSR